MWGQPNQQEKSRTLSSTASSINRLCARSYVRYISIYLLLRPAHNQVVFAKIHAPLWTAANMLWFRVWCQPLQRHRTIVGNVSCARDQDCHCRAEWKNSTRIQCGWIQFWRSTICRANCAACKSHKATDSSGFPENPDDMPAGHLGLSTIVPECGVAADDDVRHPWRRTWT